MSTNVEDKRLKILHILNSKKDAISSQVITKELNEQGVKISERTVRFHLLAMDKKGFTQYIERKGRLLTTLGVMELTCVKAYEKVGFLSAKIDEYSYKMNFDIDKKEGSVLVNITLVKKDDFVESIELLETAFRNGFSMGQLLTIFYPEDSTEGIHIPEGFIGIGSVCSITLNGILLSRGIPVNSLFGGLLEVKDGIAKRFLEIIKYSGSSLDPLEIFISSGLTDHSGVCCSGSGIVGGSFREIPSTCREEAISIINRCKEIGLGGFLDIGFPGDPLLEIPVSAGRVGFIVTGGLNAVGLLAESGIKLYSKTLSGYVDFSRLFHYTELKQKLR
ncbi:MAG: NrpR regulatory domain-containing protein [Spirochaetaceae bacterium]